MDDVVDLATRKSGSIAVALIWDRNAETLRVCAYDGLTGEEIRRLGTGRRRTPPASARLRRGRR
jgi:hypothetical protein